MIETKKKKEQEKKGKEKRGEEKGEEEERMQKQILVSTKGNEIHHKQSFHIPISPLNFTRIIIIIGKQTILSLSRNYSLFLF